MSSKNCYQFLIGIIILLIAILGVVISQKHQTEPPVQQPVAEKTFHKTLNGENFIIGNSKIVVTLPGGWRAFKESKDNPEVCSYERVFVNPEITTNSRFFPAVLLLVM